MPGKHPNPTHLYTAFGVFARLVLCAIFVASLWTIARDWSTLMAGGGWFAALGQFFAVFCTLTLIAIGLVLAVCLLCLPVLIYYAASPAISPERSLGDWVLLVMNPPWKALWWAVWWLRRTWRAL